VLVKSFFQAHLDSCDADHHRIENYLMTEHPLYIGKAGIKGLGLFSIFILEKPLKEVCLKKM
jgi:hypothetical protein